jgi:hypothetical protein
MKMMNKRVLEWEQGATGWPEDLNVQELNRALDAWARRRGIVWGNGFRRTADEIFRKPRRKGAE